MSLHGHAKIELTNVKTGEVQTVEHDNMFTNALNDMFNSTIGIKYLFLDEQNMFPLVEKALGGIVLMNKTLEENPDKYDLPNNQYITGYASNDVNSGTNTYRGSRNLTESKKIENGYRFVWDFNTAQGNGVIASLGLTHKATGVDGFKSALPSGNNPFQYNTPYGLQNQPEDLRKYFFFQVSFDFNTSTQISIKNIDNTHIIVCKFFIPFIFAEKHIIDTDLANGYSGKYPFPRLIEKKEIVSNIEIEDYNNHRWIENPEDDYYYCISYSNSLKKIKVIRMNKKTLVVDENFILEKENIDFYNYQYGSSSFYHNTERDIEACSNSSFIYNNKIYLTGKSNNPNKFFSYSLTNSLEENEESFSYSSTWGDWCVDSENEVLYSYNQIIQNNKDIYTYSTGYYDTTNWFKDELEFMGRSKRTFFGYASSRSEDSSGLYGIIRYYYAIDTRYLATINNLDTPITKTSDQSMKITYTITEVEDEQ